ncbi:hypothetical protein ACN9RQ_002370 [Vibrio parahaemolyticus]|uniref:hypothetical protein n=1 Tax=Vibrio parahaemolyticus TaxID=670 RepID=UPI0015E04D21|nr:hypothetical protein [Vibrio parahaemolyticus]EKB1966864.1 hypothetical protein [Vibrio parahaemolyticus]MBE3850024.1 hypothetical protein [Vibrio parahaemolyticus]MBE4282854.1 hypothetical protein [Vibrio parahaemolyticus]HCE2440461.1 hypothetical protein [Vibrio parahaemolyticus]HCG6522278.1 hypothetical protein [Vibrio parahaemolyticus]
MQTKHTKATRPMMMSRSEVELLELLIKQFKEQECEWQILVRIKSDKLEQCLDA